MKLIPSPNDFVSKSAVPGQRAQQENYKLIIQNANLIIRSKKLTSTAHKALMNLFVLSGAIPDLVVVGQVSDADLASG